MEQVTEKLTAEFPALTLAEAQRVAWWLAAAGMPEAVWKGLLDRNTFVPFSYAMYGLYQA